MRPDCELTPGEIEEARRQAAPGERAFFRSLADLSDGLIARTPVDIPTWCADNLFMPAGKTTRGGPVILSPIQAEITRLWQDPEVDQVSFLKPPRIGSSFINAAGLLYYSCHEASDTIFYERSDDTAQEFNNDKLMPLFEESVSIAPLIRKASKHGIQDRWTDKLLLTGASLKLRSADNNGSFRGIRGRFIVCDEVGAKAYRASGKNSEGSKMDLVRRRGQEFSDFTLYIGGTPTRVGECTISEEYEKSDKRHFFMFSPCCPDERQAFEPDVRRAVDRETPYGPGLRYLTNERGIPFEAWYECRFCQFHIQETSKVSMMETGRFEATDIGEPGHVGVYAWSIHSTDPKSTWKHIASAHSKAVKDPTLLQSFTNVWLAKPWEEPIQRDNDPLELAKKILELPDGIHVPQFGEFLFAGIDGQEGNLHRPDRPERVEAVTYAVGANRRRHVIDRSVFSHVAVYDAITDQDIMEPITAFGPNSARVIEEYLARDWVREDGLLMRITGAFVDAGWRNTEVLEFTSQPKLRRRGVRAVRGSKELFGRRPVIPPKESYSKRHKRPFLWLGTKAAKDTLDRTLKIPAPAPESWTFSSKFERDFYESLLAEHQVQMPNGERVWRRITEEETGEVWDCLVYAYAAECYARQHSRKVDEIISKLDEVALEQAILQQARANAEFVPTPETTSTPMNSEAVPVQTSEDAPPPPAPESRFSFVRKGARTPAAPVPKVVVPDTPPPAARRRDGPISRMPGIWGG